MIIILWLILFGLFFGSYITYFIYLKFHADKKWGLKKDIQFNPNITILVPAHNEEKVIQSKLKNLSEVNYPKEKMEIIFIDDASTDKTLVKTCDYLKYHPELPVKVLKQNPRKGKSSALNIGLEASSNDIVVVTDADSFWPPDILMKALPYISNPTIGAITGRSVSIKSNESWVTKAEEDYLNLINLLRLGESKIHSTIRFEGCFCIFKKGAFDKFDYESGADDSGTAFKVVQNGFRAILIPEIYAFSEFPNELRSRVKVKIRRAIHLSGLWFKCFKLLLEERLLLPKRIAIPEIFISIFNPIIFIILDFATLLLLFSYPIVLIPLIISILILGLIPKIRRFLFNGILDHFILLYSIVYYASNKRIVAWDK